MRESAEINLQTASRLKQKGKFREAIEFIGRPLIYD
jgi:hypothetical protein